LESGGSPELDSATALAAARCALDDKGDFRYGNAPKLEAEFCALNLYTPGERFIAVDIALSLIRPEDRCGPDSPGNVSFPPYAGRTLYAFKWNSSEFGTLMYLKFCLAGTTGTELLVLYSFHEDRP
jgi:hypothetical protein